MSIFIRFVSAGVLFEGAFSLWVSLKKPTTEMVVGLDGQPFSGQQAFEG